jgi:nicotinate-nucleotide adenylyltransferase
MRIPATSDGMTVGLFGGSFNPPHAGHVHVSEIATPGNPLKDYSELAPLGDRLAACEAIMRHPRVEITALEARFKVRYTADTLALLTRLRPRVRFVWIMGADNLASFHRWQDWRRIASMVPIMVIDRPGSTLSFLSARAAIALARYRIDETDASLLARLDPPAWTFIHAPRMPHSSSAIRKARKTAALTKG